ncbi:hypothetical protein HUN01_01315 (plasmid) [Nostoc edaphicum CCNP1411]|uniref:Uncharacterized protein n=1 Tax=Nostoc edaphicum CCNP1411 TaxID=1472755 RepID=A0A7D7QZA5_9NOSO|nr:hypothetical protein [Nostoc edaphicum]QMS86286.1 hypothetical protein HUN01_01315 [Nostoc edaphicum CCNP1411]
MRVVAIAIDKLKLIRCDRFRDANGVTILWVINYTLSALRVIDDRKYCNSVGDTNAIAPHQFQLINRNRYNPHDTVG